MKRTARDTGPSPQQRLHVYMRAGYRCERCGGTGPAFSVHHRLPRGRGGENRLSNLVLLCGSATTPGGCHGEVESYREQAYDDGWLVRTGIDPATVPVNIHGPRERTLLDDDGFYEVA